MGSSKSFLALALLFGASSAHAFTLNIQDGDLTGWAEDPVAISYDLSACPTMTNGVSVLDALQAAFDLWNSVAESSLRLELGAQTSMSSTDIQNKNSSGAPVIVCDSSFGTITGVDPSSVPGTTYMVRNTATNSIIFAGIILNAQSGAQAAIDKLSGARLKILIAHELGHAIGLGHSSDQSALMYYDITSKAEAALAQDDYDGVTYLYGRKELFNAGPFGCGTVERTRGGGGGGDGGAGAAELAILLSAAWVIHKACLRRPRSVES